MRYLAIALLTPWLLILCWAYWAYPKSLPRTAIRRLFDGLVLMLAAMATVYVASLGYDAAKVASGGEFGRPSGAVWQQVLPALNGYGACVAVLLAALIVRFLIWRRPSR